MKKRQANAREALSISQSAPAQELAVTTPTQPQSATTPTQRQPNLTTAAHEYTIATQPDSTLLQRHHPNSSFEDLQQQLHSTPLSASWTPVYSPSSIQLCLVKVAPMSQAKIERSITVNTSMSWHVHIAGKLVAVATNRVLKEFPGYIPDIKCLQHIMQCVEMAHICPGNPQPEFVEIANKRCGSSASGKVAFVDSEVEVMDINGRMYGRTVRRSDCELLCPPNSSRPKRCRNCMQYRSQLRVAKSRNQRQDSSGRIAHDSYCNIRYLSEEENVQRLHSAQKQKIA